MTMSPLEAETASENVTFEHFGRTWTVPAKRRLSHIKRMRDEMRAGVGTIDLMIAETFLAPEDFEALLELDPDEGQLDEFTSQIAKVMGLGDSGNS